MNILQNGDIVLNKDEETNELASTSDSLTADSFADCVIKD